MNSKSHKNLNMIDISTFETQENSHLLLVICIHEMVCCEKCCICHLYESHLTTKPVISVSSTQLHIYWAFAFPAMPTIGQLDNSNQICPFFPYRKKLIEQMKYHRIK